jgi:predicted nucleic acid-binding protein
VPVIGIDSFGWLERLLNGPKAQKYNEVFESVDPAEIVTSTVSVYEVYKKLRALKGESAALEAIVHMRATTIVALDDQLALEAADYALDHSLHFADAVVYATARRFGAELHTSDPDLKEIPGVVFH